MRVAIDYTSALAQGAGVGRYTGELVRELIAQAGDFGFVLYHGSDSILVPNEHERPAVADCRLPLPSRLATVAWQRLRLPLPLERFTGTIDLSHGPDFVAPPSRAPSVVTVHDLTYLVTPQFAYPNLRRFLERAVPHSLVRARRVIAVSEATRRDLLTYYGLDEAVVVAIPNGVDPSFRRPDDAVIGERLAALGIQQPYFLTVGTIEPRKNHTTLLKAFAAVAARYPEASLVIAGHPGWLSEPILAEIAAAAERHRVLLRSDIDDADLPSLYAGALALAYPSWYEGFGLPVLEAMACGTPVIASDRGSLPEVVGTAGLLVSPRDPEALAAAMGSLLQDDAGRRRLAALGLDRVREFSWERTARETLQLYREATA